MLPAVLLFFNVSVLAEQGEAMIEVINGELSTFLVERDGEKLIPYYTMLVQERDKIYINEARSKDVQNYIKLDFGGSKFEYITHADSPYLVKRRKTAMSMPENLLNEFRSLWTKWTQRKNRNVMAIPKSVGQFSVPLLSKGVTQLISKGNRVLHLGWKGGKGPYTVELYQCQSNSPLKKKVVYETQMQFERREWRGCYFVKVKDSRMKEPIKRKFEAVNDSDEYPKPKLSTMERKGMKIPELAEKVWQAVWLTQQVGGAWKFEAYQQLVGMSDYQPALVVKEGLQASVTQ